MTSTKFSLKVEIEKKKYSKVVDMLKKLSINFFLFEEHEKMPGCVKFMKDFVKKRTISYKDIGSLHHYSTITSRLLVLNKGDTSTFIIPCTIGSSRFVELCAT